MDGAIVDVLDGILVWIFWVVSGTSLPWMPAGRRVGWGRFEMPG